MNSIYLYIIMFLSGIYLGIKICELTIYYVNKKEAQNE